MTVLFGSHDAGKTNILELIESCSGKIRLRHAPTLSRTSLSPLSRLSFGRETSEHAAASGLGREPRPAEIATQVENQLGVAHQLTDRFGAAS